MSPTPALLRIILLTRTHTLTPTGSSRWLASPTLNPMVSTHKQCGGRRRRWTALVSILIALSSVAADIEVQRRLSSQLPQLGHVGLPFSWTFADDTFLATKDGEISSGSSSASAPPSTDTISFKVDGLPSWASFDASSRMFTGAPQSHDQGRSTVKLTATDSDGSSTEDSFSLIVIEAPPPTLKMPLAPQLPTVNSIGAQYVLPDGSQFIPHGWSFSLGFSGYSFQLPNWETIYYTATRGDGSALPTWMTFSAESFTFDGVVPASPSTADSAFDVMITASNMRGFGGTADSFRLVLDNHLLTLAHPLRMVNATAGSSFHYTVPTTGVQLNGKQAPQDDSISVDAKISPSYPWLSFDAGTSTLSGTPPFNFSTSSSDSLDPQPVAVPVVFSDHTSNFTTNTTLTLNVYPSLFTLEALPNMNIDPGMPFNVSLQQFLRSPLDPSTVRLNLTYDPAEASSWFAFNTSTFFLSGRTPADAVLDKVKIRVDASSNVSDDFARSGSTTFFVGLNGNQLDPSSSASDDHHQDSNGMTDRTRMALGASLGTVGGLLFLFLLILGCRRWVAEEEHDLTHDIYVHKDLGSFETDVQGKSPALSGLYVPHSQLRMSKGYNASQVKIKTSPYLEPTSILVAPVLSANPKANNGVVAWADNDQHSAALEQVVVGDGGGSPTLNEAVAAYRQAEAVAMSNAAHVRDRERPRPNGLLAAIFTSKKPRTSQKGDNGLITHGPYVASPSAGLGLSGLGIGEDAEDPSDLSGGRVAHSRSRHTVQSRKSSWEEGIWHDGDPRAAGGNANDLQIREDVLASPESAQSLASSAPSIPQRRGGANLLFGNKSGLGPMRHRNSHINDSPAFQTTGTFDTTVSSGTSGMPMSDSRQRMFDEARTGLEQRVLSAGVGLNGGAGASGRGAEGLVNVRSMGHRHPISIEESKLRNVSHAVSSEGAFEDADEDIGSAGMYGADQYYQHDLYDGDDDDVLQQELSTAEIVAAGRALTTESAMAARRQSVLSYTTNHDSDQAVQGAAIFSEAALKTIPTFSLRPEETLRAVGDAKMFRY
ncbi:hypothetical protein CF327_g967 [Tilletia walkeri]|nr:hypothetical protein CF327_g967 [Tilletia walkeri]